MIPFENRQFHGDWRLEHAFLSLARPLLRVFSGLEENSVVEEWWIKSEWYTGKRSGIPQVDFKINLFSNPMCILSVQEFHCWFLSGTSPGWSLLMSTPNWHQTLGKIQAWPFRAWTRERNYCRNCGDVGRTKVSLHFIALLLLLTTFVIYISFHLTYYLPVQELLYNYKL